MKMVYAHFPINLVVLEAGKGIEIRNFLGEKRTRKIFMSQNVTCHKKENSKDEIIVKGTDVTLVSMSAASIQQSCLVKNKDIRKFLDGIYIATKEKMD
jgi:large subunit ribosomal protein L9e